MKACILILSCMAVSLSIVEARYQNNNCNFQYKMCMRRGRQPRRVCNQQLNQCNLFGTSTLPFTSTTSSYTTTYPTTSSTTSYYTTTYPATSSTTSYYTSPTTSSTTSFYTTTPYITTTKPCRGKRCRNQYRQQVEAAPACTGMLCKLGLLGNKGGLSELLSQHTAGGNQVSQHTTNDAAKTGGRDGISGQLGLLGSGSGGFLQSLGINIGK